MDSIVVAFPPSPPSEETMAAMKETWKVYNISMHVQFVECTIVLCMILRVLGLRSGDCNVEIM